MAGSSAAALFLALGRLRPDPEAALQITCVLRLSWDFNEPDPPPPRRLPSQPLPETLEPRALELERQERPRQDPDETSRLETLSDDGLELRIQLQRVIPAARDQPSLVLPRLSSEKGLPGSELPFEPLLRPVVTRSVIGAALVRSRREGPIDVTRLADSIARRQPIRRIPRRTYKTVAPSTRILVDRGPGMALFTRDANDLARRVSLVASRDRTEVLRFWQTPWRVGTTARSSERLRSPPRATAVIALTDLGISRAGTRVPDLVEHWLEFAEELREADCQLVVFVPYPPSRWPAALAERVSLVSWDRRTSLADVRAALVPKRSRT